MSVVEKEVNMTRVRTPSFLTLAKLPANQVGFRIVREDIADMSKKVKRGETLLTIQFEAGLSEDECKSVLSQWGMSVEDYTMEEDGDHFVAKRCDLSPDTPCVTFGVGNGRKVTVMAPAPAKRSDGDKAAIAVVEINFRIDAFPTVEDAKAWLEANGVEDVPLTLSGETVTAKRIDKAAEEETATITVDTGVDFVITRADVQDIPVKFIDVVSETAYGSYGWGQLDFAAAMADVEYSDAVEDAQDTLRKVLNNLLYWSPLPTSVRKDLVTKACTQFAAYVGTLLDALPARVVVAIRNDFKEQEKKEMSKPEETKPPVARADETPPATGTENAATAAPDKEPETSAVTREDVAKMVADATSPIMEQLKAISEKIPATGEPAKRADETPPAADVMQEMVTTLKGLSERVERMEGATTVRSDKDVKPAPAAQRGDVFKGVFGTIGTTAAD